MSEPNLRQKEAFKKMLENGGKMQPAMEAVGYGKGYAKNPDKLKKTSGWKFLLKKYLPDRKLVKVAEEGLAATITKTKDPDFAVRQRYLETALKMKGKLIDRTDLTSGNKPIPLLGDVYNHNSNQKANQAEKED